MSSEKTTQQVDREFDALRVALNLLRNNKARTLREVRRMVIEEGFSADEVDSALRLWAKSELGHGTF